MGADETLKTRANAMQGMPGREPAGTIPSLCRDFPGWSGGGPYAGLLKFSATYLVSLPALSIIVVSMPEFCNGFACRSMNRR